MAQQKKSRAWRFLVYPENLKDEWYIILNQNGLKWALSPLHDKDTKLDGSLVKPHRHAIIIWPGPTTQKHVNEVAQEIGFHTPALSCDYPTEAYKYFTHDEHTDKVKYDREDIVTSSNFSPDDLSEIKNEEEDEIIRVIKSYIREYKLYNSWSLDEYLETDNDIRLWRYYRSHSLYFNSILKGYKDTLPKQEK